MQEDVTGHELGRVGSTPEPSPLGKVVPGSVVGLALLGAGGLVAFCWWMAAATLKPPPAPPPPAGLAGIKPALR